MALDVEVLGHDDVGVGEDAVEVGAVGDLDLVDHVGADLGHEQRGVVGRGVQRAEHRVELFEVDLDVLARVLGHVRALGHDHRDRVADVAHAVARERGLQGAHGVLGREQPHRHGDLGHVARR